MYRAVKRLAVVAAAMSSLAATGATAQSISFGPERSTASSGGTITFNLAVSSSMSGSASLNITYFGDLGSPSEFLDVFVDGVVVGRLPGGFVNAECGADAAATLTIPAATLATAAADGNLTISVTDTSTTQVNNFCSTASSATFNMDNAASIFSGSTAFAIQGTLTGATFSAAPSALDDADIVASRGSQIMASSINTPRRIGRLQSGSGFVSGGLSFMGAPVSGIEGADIQVTQGAASFATGFDIGNAVIWAEGQVVSFNDDLTDEGRFGIVHFGTDWFLNPDLMVGFAAQVDMFEQEAAGGGDEFSGVGYMVGPVATARLTQDLYLDGRLAYGIGDNEIDRGASVDSFDSTRALAEIAVIGQLEANGFTFFPEAELAYFMEETDAYTSGTLGAIDAARVSIGQARLGGLVERPFDLGQGQMLVGYFEAFSVYTHRAEGTLAAGSFTQIIEGFSAEAEIGARFTTDTGATIYGSLGTGGLFTDTESYSASFGLRIPLQ